MKYSCATNQENITRHIAKSSLQPSSASKELPFCENVVNSDVEIFFTLAFQKIEEWNFFPIVDMSLRSWGQHLLDDHHLQEVIKDEIFTWHSGEEFPKHTRILK